MHRRTPVRRSVDRTPAPETVNETLLNGAPLTTPRTLNDGDVLAAGRSAKGISKLPLTARASMTAGSATPAIIAETSGQAPVAEPLVSPEVEQSAVPEAEASASPLPPSRSRRAVDVHDLDWDRIAASVAPGAVRARMRETVEQLETVLDSESGLRMLFDDQRESRADRAWRIAEIPDAPLWFIGDLHGDLLTLEAALVLIDRESEREIKGHARIVLLGDLFDDGGYGLETLLRVFELMLRRASHLCLLVGNHDEALGYNGSRFTATVSPSDFSDFLNENLAHEWIGRAGKLAVRIVLDAPRALFFPDGLLAAHGGFPLRDLHERLAESGEWNDPQCLSDFVWTRAHPRARKKLPNRSIAREPIRLRGLRGLLRTERDARPARDAHDPRPRSRRGTVRNFSRVRSDAGAHDRRSLPEA